MVHVPDWKTVTELKEDKWGIKQPPPVHSWAEAYGSANDTLDLVIMPGTS